MRHDAGYARSSRNDDGTMRIEIAELQMLEALVQRAGQHMEARVIAHAEGRGQQWPVWALALGNATRDRPAVCFVGGVHGLERIGAEVVLAWLGHLVGRLDWDRTLHALLEMVRLVFVPVVNPGGMALGTRANPQGVDLMRNAPVDADAAVPLLVGGHRVGAWLPWYRGRAGEPMQVEAQALCELVEAELGGRPLALSVDCHSGFGMRDRLWFPHAGTRRPLAQLAEVASLHGLLERTHPHHDYVFEPQSRQYLAHGDLWDHLHQRMQAHTLLLPLTLEMGSWLWVRKNPRQLFSRLGMFNPLIGHRQSRVLRRHLPLFEFLVRAAASHAEWLPRGAERTAAEIVGMHRWFGGQR